MRPRRHRLHDLLSMEKTTVQGDILKLLWLLIFAISLPALGAFGGSRSGGFSGGGRSFGGSRSFSSPMRSSPSPSRSAGSTFGGNRSAGSGVTITRPTPPSAPSAAAAP